MKTIKELKKVLTPDKRVLGLYVVLGFIVILSGVYFFVLAAHYFTFLLALHTFFYIVDKTSSFFRKTGIIIYLLPFAISLIIFACTSYYLTGFMVNALLFVISTEEVALSNVYIGMVISLFSGFIFCSLAASYLLSVSIFWFKDKKQIARRKKIKRPFLTLSLVTILMFILFWFLFLIL